MKNLLQNSCCVTLAIGIMLIHQGCFTIENTHSNWEENSTPIVSNGPGSCRRISRIKYRTDDGGRISVGFFPGIAEVAEKGKMYDTKVENAAELYFAYPVLLLPFVNVFTLCYPTVEGLFLSPFGVHAMSDCALIGTHRWKSSRYNAHRERVKVDYEENIIEHDNTADPRAVAVIMADGRRLWFAYPGYSAISDEVRKTGEAYVLHGDGRRVRRFYCSKNVKDELSYEDRWASPPERAAWNSKNSELMVVKGFDAVLDGLKNDKDDVKCRELLNTLKIYLGKANECFLSSEMDEKRLIPLKENLSMMEMRACEFAQNKQREKLISKALEAVEIEIGKYREEPEFKQVISDQVACVSVFKSYVKSEKVDLCVALNIVLKVESLQRGVADARVKLENRHKAEAEAIAEAKRRADAQKEIARLENVKKDVLSLLSEAKVIDSESAMQKYDYAIVMCQLEQTKSRENSQDQFGDELLGLGEKCWDELLARAMEGKRDARKQYNLDVRKKAEGGDPAAQFKLYTILRDSADASEPEEKWLKLAAENGNEDACSVLRERQEEKLRLEEEAARLEKERRLARISSFCGVRFGDRIENVASDVRFHDGAAWHKHGHRQYQMSYMIGEYENSRPFRNFRDADIYADMTSKKIYQIVFVFKPSRDSTVALEEAEYKDTLRALRRKYGEIDSSNESFGGDKYHKFVVDELVVEFRWITEGIIDDGRLVLIATRKDLEQEANDSSRKYYDSRVQKDLDNREKFENDGVDAL